MKEKDLKKRGWLWDDDGNDGDNKPKDVEVYYTEDDSGYVVGIPLCESEDYGLSSAEVSFEKLESIRQDLLTLGIPNVKLLVGTRPT